MQLDFDLRLARECANAFCGATGLGCTVSDTQGRVLYERGPGCASCRICTAAGRPQEDCARAHIYGMTEAERFGGKYIYFCPMGLTCFVSPVLEDEEEVAVIVSHAVHEVLGGDLFGHMLAQLVVQVVVVQAVVRRIEAVGVGAGIVGGQIGDARLLQHGDGVGQ